MSEFCPGVNASDCTDHESPADAAANDGSERRQGRFTSEHRKPIRASQAHVGPTHQNEGEASWRGQDAPTATNAGSAGITQKAVHQTVKIALQKTDWLGIAPLCKSTGHQIGPGLVADLSGLCRL